jgi:POT family proton-dependent oligopeptide transporter
MMIGVNSLNIFAGSLISGRIGSLYEQVDASTFWMIHAAIVAGGGIGLLLFGGLLRRLLAQGGEVGH